MCVAGGSRALRRWDPHGTGRVLPVGAACSREFGRLTGLRLPSSQHQGGFSWYVSPSCGPAAPGLVCPFLFPCCEFRGRAVGVSASSSLAVLKELLCSLCCIPGASGTAVGRSLSSPFPLGSGNTFPPAEDVFKVGTMQLCK